MRADAVTIRELTTAFLVLGHSQCGAVKAAIKHLEARDALPGAIRDLVEAIKPVVARIKGVPGDRLANAIRANVAAGVDRLRRSSPPWPRRSGTVG